MQDDIRIGDILLYVGNSNSIEDRLIEHFTYGPYVHCSIVSDENSMIESVGLTGVRKSIIRNPNMIMALNNNISSEQINDGIRFLSRRIGSSYGVFDIAADVVKTILPKNISGTPLLISPSAFSCSTLATLFLMVIGYKPIPDSWYLSPHTVSPNEIFRVMSKI